MITEVELKVNVSGTTDYSSVKFLNTKFCLEKPFSIKLDISEGYECTSTTLSEEDSS